MQFKFVMTQSFVLTFHFNSKMSPSYVWILLQQFSVKGLLTETQLDLVISFLLRFPIRLKELLQSGN